MELWYLHPRVRNAKRMRASDWRAPNLLYVGRNHCPCKQPSCEHDTGLGNPFNVARDGDDVPRLFHDMLKNNAKLLERIRAECAPPTILVCWCDGPNARWCHAETYARLGDGEALEAIAADVLGRFA